MGKNGAEGGAEGNEKQPHIITFSTVQLSESGVEDVVYGVVITPIWTTGELKLVK